MSLSAGFGGKALNMQGLYPATVTPFLPNGQIDVEALRAHLARTYAAKGVKGVVVNSGIGELLQLQPEEMLLSIEVAMSVRAEGQLVIAGVEGHNPDKLIAAAKQARDAGADALLVLPPFDRRAYRRLNKDVASVRAVFERLDKEVALPMVVFQYPESSGSAYSLEALLAISDLPNVVAIKTATEGDVQTYVEMWDLLKDKMAVLVGVDSPPLIEMLRYGSHGALIGISAISTESWGQLLELVEAGDTAQADALYGKVCLPLMDAVFQNQKPTTLMNEAAATKEALFQMGEIPRANARFPAVHPSEEQRGKIRVALTDAGLI
ncbi:dihydrodipicolinate synthase family protein [Devosia sp. MC532]|uniref:dihydrodipicolinate synthase family protein n=1 Tax=Devosia sp. MC532 TaxID=2799788 RepID=UPI0018F57903|nr:dihydrodipicolinate synthase family protein [Devosia sp. MC532]MBJ7578235.1 dihydrodipicolinate synthase family protein [Devosia sp. MC532]